MRIAPKAAGRSFCPSPARSTRMFPNRLPEEALVIDGAPEVLGRFGHHQRK